MSKLTVGELCRLSYKKQRIEIASKERYYYGMVGNVPKMLKDFVVDYVAAGASDSRGDLALLVDAHKE